MNSSTHSAGLSSAGELAGRVLLAHLFIVEGLGKLGAYGAAASYMMTYGLPGALLPFAIVCEIAAGGLIVLGWRTRIAAFVLAAFCVVAAVVFHTKFSDRNQLIHFEKDLALAGAFLILWLRGAGALSLDVLRERRRLAATRPVPMQAPASAGRLRAGRDFSAKAER